MSVQRSDTRVLRDARIFHHTTSRLLSELRVGLRQDRPWRPSKRHARTLAQLAGRRG